MNWKDNLSYFELNIENTKRWCIIQHLIQDHGRIVYGLNYIAIYDSLTESQRELMLVDI